MSLQPQQPGAIGADAPWSLRIAAWCWGVAGALLALCPALAGLLLGLQYRALRGHAYRAADATEFFDFDDRIDLAPYLAEFERIEAWVLGLGGWVLALLLFIYLGMAAAGLTAYVLIAKATFRGSNWARILGTVLAGLSAPLVFALWQFFVAFAWLPLDALWANHLGLVALLLHAIGIVLVWLPPSNDFARARAAARIATPADVGELGR